MSDDASDSKLNCDGLGGRTDKPLSTANGVVRCSDTELIDQSGRLYIRTDAGLRGVVFAFVVGGGIGTVIGLTIGLYIGGGLPL